MNFTIEMYYKWFLLLQMIFIVKCISNDFYYKNALKIILL